MSVPITNIVVNASQAIAVADTFFTADVAESSVLFFVCVELIFQHRREGWDGGNYFDVGNGVENREGVYWAGPAGFLPQAE
ncbi:hypothetical protein GCM10010361_41050 [Streptomyces olivaceiscleroticus]|uniref:Uncharacterized protein n=1 Tax=Streptomyces olivaceiscleroticus TaxID=68245 RepID=A0ABN1ABW5_9ACTN